MATVHTTYLFSVQGNAETFEKQCKTPMHSLLTNVSIDPRLTDSTEYVNSNEENRAA